MERTIYNLELHESIMVKHKGEGSPTEWKVTRVPGGWFYQDDSPSRTTVSEFFVPFNNEFQVPTKDDKMEEFLNEKAKV